MPRSLNNKVYVATRDTDFTLTMKYEKEPDFSEKPQRLTFQKVEGFFFSLKDTLLLFLALFFSGQVYEA